MLQSLSISNYAIIDKVNIQFAPQLNIITGETGAGKSIPLGALHLILGKRADSNVLRNKEEKCTIEAIFSIRNYSLNYFFELYDLEYEPETIIRREINANGKSRAFINDTPVNLQQLKKLSAMLVDLHQQFDTLELGEMDFQREVLDALADNEKILLQYRDTYNRWKKCETELKEMTAKKNNFLKDYDYNKFLFDELDQASLKENEIEEAEKEIKILSHAGDIKTALSKIYFELKENETPVLSLLKQLANSLSAYTQYHEGLEAIIQRLSSVQIELADIADETEQINDSIQYDEKRIDVLNEKMNLGYKLLKKHGVQSTAELLEIKQSLEIKLQDVLQIDEMIAAKEKETDSLLKEAEILADKISASRKTAVLPFEKNINGLLKNVGMPNARIKVGLSNTILNEWGKDNIEFLFNANMPAGSSADSGHYLPLNKVASGGELSRLMLCIKSLVAEKINLPTLIFDEIDTGVSGDVALKMAQLMKGMSRSHQVITITHLPQIASFGEKHLFVYKDHSSETSTSNMRVLDAHERVQHIAEMIGGKEPTALAVANAKEMLNQNNY